ncbi:hypothetical protein AB4Z22_01620, partial [Paenibacillus sp. TAF58]
MNRTMKKSLAILSLSAMMTTGAAYAATNETVTTQAAPTAISVQVNEGALCVFTTVKTGEDHYAINKIFTTLGTTPELVDNKLYM